MELRRRTRFFNGRRAARHGGASVDTWRQTRRPPSDFFRVRLLQGFAHGVTT